jgi:hypothetical protein
MIPGLLTAAGIAMSIVPSTIAATQGAKEGQAGLASGLVNTSRQVGGGLGLAFLITLATQRSSHLIGTGVQVPQALTEGFRLAYLIGAGLAGGWRADRVRLAAEIRAGDGERRAAPRRRDRGRGRRLRRARRSRSRTRMARRSAPTHRRRLQLRDRAVAAPAELTTDSRGTAGQLAPGYIFTASFYDLNYPPMVGQSGPLILDDNLEPVWFQPVPEASSRRT